MINYLLFFFHSLIFIICVLKYKIELFVSKCDSENSFYNLLLAVCLSMDCFHLEFT